jgi:hypothetical protein
MFSILGNPRSSRIYRQFGASGDVSSDTYESSLIMNLIVACVIVVVLYEKLRKILSITAFT